MNHIDYSDFYSGQIDPIIKSYNIEDPVIERILNFYSRVQFCYEGYCIRYEKGTYSDIYRNDELETYHKFGIYFLGEQNIPDIINVTNLLVIPKETFQSCSQLESWLKDRDTSSCTFVIGMGKEEQNTWAKTAPDYNDFIGLLEEYEIVNDHIPRVDVDRAIEDATKRYSNACKFLKVFDCYEIFRENICVSNSIELNLKNIQIVANILESMVKEDSRILFTISSFKQKDQSLLFSYCAVAVYLEIKCGARFVIPESASSVYAAIYHDIYGRTYLYCHEYINNFKNVRPVNFYYPPSRFGCFVCPVKDGNNMIVQFVSAPVDDPTNITYNNVPIMNLDVIDLTELYNLHTFDYEEGFREMERLKEDTKEFYAAAYKDFPIIDCSNFFMYSKNGKRYYAVLQSINGTIKTICQPIAGIYPKIVKNFTTKEIEQMRDIRDLVNADLKKIVLKLGYTGDIEDCYIKESPAVKRILFKSAQGKAVPLSESVIAFDDYGLIGNTAAKFRTFLPEDFSKIIPIKGLRKYFLSFFGGPHPQSGIDLNITNHLWEA